MTTKKDLVEAHAYTRRRLVTAFLSGAPGGREVEPTRPGRTILGGAALALLLVAGAAIASVLSPRTSEDWASAGLIISKQTGERYVITKKSDPPELRPVINVTSAQLILGADVQPKIVSQKTLDTVTPKDDIGILGAPQQLPSPSRFIESGWTACTGQGHGLAVDIARTPHVRRSASAGFVVSDQGDFWLVAEGAPADSSLPTQAYRYHLPFGPQADNMLHDLGVVPTGSAIAVPTEWLDLLPAGGELSAASFGLKKVGQPAPGTQLPPGATVGDYVTVSNGTTYLLADDGPVRLQPFAAAVYEHSAPPQAQHLTADQEPGGNARTSPTASANWPTGALSTPRTDPCLELRAKHGAAPYVDLATDPSTTSASATDLGPRDRRDTIDPGAGAFVRSGDWGSTTSTSTFVVDDKAAAYPLVGATALKNLHYDTYPAPIVPDSWIKVLGQGVTLSTELALCPPAPTGTSKCASP